MNKMMTRRGFFIGAAATAAVPVMAKAMRTGTEVDDNLSVFISDIHVSGPDVKGTPRGDQPTWSNSLFEKTVDEILAMRPRPRRVVCFGDISLWFGYHQDYEASLSGFKRLADAGIELHLTVGNHDKREVFQRYHPQCAKASPVPGRFVSVINLGSCDLILLDSLNEGPGGEGTSNPVGGTIDKAQWDWLAAEAKRRTRPFLCGAHHSPRDMVQTVGEKREDVMSLLVNLPLFKGWVRGHEHAWGKGFASRGYGTQAPIREAVLPSTGCWGDIGYAVMRTSPGRAELSLVQNDYFFPGPLKEGEVRPAVWDEIVAENRGARCTFPL